jgi:hypothetical protein
VGALGGTVGLVAGGVLTTYVGWQYIFFFNCYNVFDAALPFGGYKQSGWGREMGHEVLEAYTEVKAVTTQL